MVLHSNVHNENVIYKCNIMNMACVCMIQRYTVISICPVSYDSILDL